MIEGLFIALEGVDGAGTTTHTALLTEALRKRGLPIHSTREPSDGPIGVLIRQFLSGRCVIPGVNGARPPSWNTMALLFAADRLDHIEAEVGPNLMDGVTVITDRYDYSSIAYQSISAGGGEDVVNWVSTLNQHARRPDLTIVLDLAPETAAKRRAQRNRSQELYETPELQVQLADFYRKIEEHFPADNIVHVSAEGSVEEVAAAILLEVKKLRGEA